MKIDKRALLLVSFLLGGVAFAAIYNVLNNTLTLTVTTEKPLVSQFTEVSDGLTINQDGTVSGTIYGGDTIWFKVQTTNRANNPIDRYPVLLINSNQGLSPGLQEIKSVLYNDKNYPNVPINITDYLYCVEEGKLVPLRSCPAKNQNEWLVIFFDNNKDGKAQPYSIGAGETLWNNITVITNASAHSQTFTIKYEEWLSLQGG